MALPKPLLMKLAAVAMVILVLIPVITVPRALAEEVVELGIGIDRSKLIMLTTIALLFSDIPLEYVERYELFNTLYIYRSGGVELVTQPYLPGDIVLNVTRAVAELKKNSNISYAISEGRVDIYVNGSLALTIEYGEDLQSWSLWVGELRNKTIDRNTIVYWRWLRANFTNEFVYYYAVYLIRNVSDTHRVYIATVAELKPDYSGYSYVFTFASYWFKNKTTFFGDWIALPEGTDSLSDYYRLVAYGVKWLSENVYNGTSPGYLKRGKSSGYVPQAYPQIANALEILADSIPQEIDLPIERGYAIVVDFLLSMIAGAIVGAIGYVTIWAITTGCDVNKWSWEQFALSIVIGAALGPLGTKIINMLGGSSIFLKLPSWLRW